MDWHALAQDIANPRLSTDSIRRDAPHEGRGRGFETTPSKPQTHLSAAKPDSRGAAAVSLTDAAPRPIFDRAWFVRSARTWLETSRACRIAGLRNSAALHLNFAASMRQDAAVTARWPS